MKRNSHALRNWAILILCVLAAVAGLKRLFREKPVEVAWTRSKTGKVEETVTSTEAGTVDSRLRARIPVLTAGKVTAINFSVGDKVKARDVVVKLDDSDARAQLELTQANLESTQFRLNQARVRLDGSTLNYNRTKALFEKSAAPQSLLDKAEVELKAATEDHGAASAFVRQLAASVKLAESALDKHNVRAPFDGVISQLNAKLGEFVSFSSSEGLNLSLGSSSKLSSGAGGGPLCEIFDPRKVYVKADIDETDASRISIGQKVRLTINALGGRSFSGSVTSISPVVLNSQEQQRTIPIEVEFDDLDLAMKDGLKIGMSADVEAIAGAKENVLYVPTLVVLEKPDGSFVFVEEGGRAVQRKIRTGMQNWERVEVAQGLSASDKVIWISDNVKVEEGMMLKLAEEREK